MRTSVLVCEGRDGIASRALDFVVEGLRGGLRHRDEAHLALTGGSSAAELFGLLSSEARARRVDWARVHVWQGDERYVPLEDPDRNWAGALAGWLDADVPVPAHRHPIPVEAGRDATWAAERYSESIGSLLPRRGGVPAFDIVLLGVGGDGHILSAFPGTAALSEGRTPALAVAAPTHIGPHVPRVTLAPYLLRAAGSVVVMVPGAAKAEVVADCLLSRPDPTRLPAQSAILPTAAWLLEPESASGL